MALQPYDLTDGDGNVVGAVIIQTTCELPLPFSRTAFEDAEEAEQFLQWLGYPVERALYTDSVFAAGMVRKWRRER